MEPDQGLWLAVDVGMGGEGQASRWLRVLGPEPWAGAVFSTLSGWNAKIALGRCPVDLQGELGTMAGERSTALEIGGGGGGGGSGREGRPSVLEQQRA